MPASRGFIRREMQPQKSVVRYCRGCLYQLFGRNYQDVEDLINHFDARRGGQASGLSLTAISVASVPDRRNAGRFADPLFPRCGYRVVNVSRRLCVFCDLSSTLTSGTGMLLPSSKYDEADEAKGSPPHSDGASSDNGLPAQSRANTQPSFEFSRRLAEEIPFLHRRVRRWHRDKADAEDLIQDTLLQALANAHLWQPGSDLRAWLFTIMRNRFRATLHKSARAAAALESFAAADSGPASDPREARLILRDLSAALRRLPGNQRSAVLLIGVEGKSYAEAAQSTGTSVGAVRSHLARGRDRLKAAVNGAEVRSPFARHPVPVPSGRAV